MGSKRAFEIRDGGMAWRRADEGESTPRNARGSHRIDTYMSPWLRRTADRAAREEGVSLGELVRNGLKRELEALGYPMPLGAVVPEELVDAPVKGFDELALIDAVGRDGYRKP
jgi:hypothetical protein